MLPLYMKRPNIRVTADARMDKLFDNKCKQPRMGGSQNKPSAELETEEEKNVELPITEPNSKKDGTLRSYQWKYIR